MLCDLMYISTIKHKEAKNMSELLQDRSNLSGEQTAPKQARLIAAHVLYTPDEGVFLNSDSDTLAEDVTFETKQKTLRNDVVLEKVMTASSSDEAVILLNSIDEDAYDHRLSAATYLLGESTDLRPEDIKFLKEVTRQNALELTAYTVPHDKIRDVISAESSIPLDDIGYAYPPTTWQTERVIDAWNLTHDETVYKAAIHMVEAARMFDELRINLLGALKHAHEEGSNVPKLPSGYSVLAMMNSMYSPTST